MGDKKANRLGGVDRASSPQTDQTVTTIRVVLLKAGQDIRFRRVALYALEKDCWLDRGCDLGNQTRGHQPGVGHDQRPRDSQPVQLGRQRGPRPVTEDNTIGKSKSRVSASDHPVGRHVCLRRGPRQFGRTPYATA